MVARMEPGNGGGRVIKRLKQQASDVSDRVREEARSIRDQVADKAGEMTELIKDEANKLVDEQKSRAAEKIEKVGSVIRKTGSILKAGKAGGIAQYVDMAAETTEQASKYLEDSDLNQIAHDLADVIRRHPVAFYGSMLLAGVALGRFVKAGAESDESQD